MNINKYFFLVILTIIIVLTGYLNSPANLNAQSNKATQEDQFEKTVLDIIQKNKEQADYQKVLDSQKPKAEHYQAAILKQTYQEPLKAPALWEKTSDETINALVNRKFAGVLEQLARFLDLPLESSQIKLPDVPAKEAGWNEHLAYLKTIFEQTNKSLENIHDPVTLNTLKNLGNGVSPKGAPSFASSMPDEVKVQLFTAAILMTAFFNQDYLTNLQNCLKNNTFEKTEVKTETAAGNILYLEETNFGLIIIGGPDKNTYSREAALIIDLGGDDTYLNNSGATTSKIPSACVIDFQGNDTYQSKDNIAQGAGVCGIGYLIDLKGNDTYQASGQAQGCGINGVGWLMDLSGNDKYSGDSYNQGAGPNAVGLLTDFEGDDCYESLFGAQGFAKSKGIGLLFDAKGKDSYKCGFKYLDPVQSRQEGDPGATLSNGQGFGEYNAIGLLLELEGNDTYEVCYFGQGSGYQSFGLLRDLKGNDEYQGRRYTQGQGVHNGIGILIDEDGNDKYNNGKVAAQGAGFDYSIGILYDKKGNDTYAAAGQSQGHGAGLSLGFLIDLNTKTKPQIKKPTYEAMNQEKGFGILLK